jgi:hypothetical protein
LAGENCQYSPVRAIRQQDKDASLSNTVSELAQAIYDDRSFDRLLELADAMQKAGCDSEETLNHLRGTGPHVRGCWALDLVLGKK